MTNKTASQCRRLFISELLATGICGYLIYILSTTLDSGLDSRLILPGGTLIFTLLQGCGYWLYRKQLAEGAAINQAQILRIFAGLKKIEPFLFILYPLFLLYLLIFNREALFVPFNIFGGILYMFAIIEFTNYYYFDFNIFNLKKREPSDLATELAAYSKGDH